MSEGVSTTTSTKPEKPKRSSTRKKSTTKKSIETLPAAEEARIGEYLTNIYQDNDGHMPDMKNIAVKKNGSFLRTLTSFFGICILLVGLGWLGYFWWGGATKTTASQAKVTISGPEHIAVGASTTYTIVAENTDKNTINQATLQVFYPTGFVFQDSNVSSTNAGHNEWDLGILPPHSKKILTISGQNFGAVQSTAAWRAFLTYQPQNVNSTLEESASFNSFIDSSPFELSVAGVNTLTLGNEVEYTFTLKNINNWQPAQLYVTPVLPSYFTITSSSPQLDDHIRWVVPPLPTSTTSTDAINSYTFKLRGTISKTDDTTTTIGSTLILPLGSNNQLYQLAQASLPVSIAQSGVVLNTAVNGSVDDSVTHPGDTLTLTLQARNAGTTDISNGVLKLVFDAPSIKKSSILQWDKLVDKNNGDVRGEQISSSVRRGTITWTSKEIPALAKIKANSEVQVDVQLPLKDAQNFDISTLTASSSIQITSSVDFADSTNTTERAVANPITLTFNSDTSFEVHDTATDSQHAITWVLNNNLHPLKDILAVATVYGNTSYTATDDPTAGAVSFDSKGKVVSWKVDSMPEGVDVLTAPFKLTVNKVDPSQNLLVGKVHVTATDTVTGQQIQLEGDEVPLQ